MSQTSLSRGLLCVAAVGALAGCSAKGSQSPLQSGANTTSAAKQTAEQICAGEVFTGDPSWGKDFYVGSTFSGKQDPLLNAAGITGFCAVPGMPNLGNTAYVIVEDSSGQVVTPGDLQFANSVYTLSEEESTWTQL